MNNLLLSEEVWVKLEQQDMFRWGTKAIIAHGGKKTARVFSFNSYVYN